MQWNKKLSGSRRSAAVQVIVVAAALLAHVPQCKIGGFVINVCGNLKNGRLCIAGAEEESAGLAEAGKVQTAGLGKRTISAEIFAGLALPDNLATFSVEHQKLRRRFGGIFGAPYGIFGFGGLVAQLVDADVLLRGGVRQANGGAKQCCKGQTIHHVFGFG